MGPRVDLGISTSHLQNVLRVTDFIIFHRLVPPAADETNDGSHWNQCEGDQAAHGYGASVCALHGNTAVETGRGYLALLMNCNPSSGNLVKYTNQPHDISTHPGSFVVRGTALTDNVSDGTAHAGKDGEDCECFVCAHFPLVYTSC